MGEAMTVKPPRPKGPPLNALRAFEAAARLGGFAKAADELCVTPGAVAQQVKQLEDWAGADLFERRAQGVVLSRVGREVSPLLETAFDAMGEAVNDLRRAAAPERIHIAASPAVAQLWLSPRLPNLRRAFPGLELSLAAMEQPPNMDREPYDIAMFMLPHGQGRELAIDQIRPACAPEMAAQLQDPKDLMHVPCLTDSAWLEDWDLWQSAQNLAPFGKLRGPSYSLYSLAVQEAVNGGGVVMGHEALIAALVAQGKLVFPFETSVATGLALTLYVRQPVAHQLADLIAALSGKGRL